DAENFDVAVHQLVDRRAGARVAVLVDLVEQPGTNLLGFLLRARARRDNLHEGVIALGEGIAARVDAHSQGAAWQGVDAAAGSPGACLRTGHARSLPQISCHSSCHDWCHEGESENESKLP